MQVSDLTDGAKVRIADFDVEGVSHDIELTYNAETKQFGGVRNNGVIVHYNFAPDTEIIHGYIDWMKPVIADEAKDVQN